MSKFVITSYLVSKVLSTVDAGLSSGLGRRKPGEMCVEAAVCYAMGLPHGDEPTCVAPALRSFKICLNDAQWSSKKARAKGLRRLAVLQLGTKTAPEFNEVEFTKQLAIFTVREILPVVLTTESLKPHAIACKAVISLKEARAAATRAAYSATRAAAAAARAAARAADAAAYSAARAADAAADAARAAAAAAAATRAAAGDEVLLLSAKGAEDILISMNVPAVKFLSLLE